MTDKEREEEAKRLSEESGISPLGVGFVAAHEMFRSLQEGGFTELQALWIVGYCMSDGSEKLGGQDE